MEQQYPLVPLRPDGCHPQSRAGEWVQNVTEKDIEVQPNMNIKSTESSVETAGNINVMDLSAPVSASNTTQPQNVTTTTPKRASLMGLPVELRLKIYGFLFNLHCSRNYKHGVGRGGPDCCDDFNARPRRALVCLCIEGYRDDPEILRSCRQIRSEATEVYYKNMEILSAVAYDSCGSWTSQLDAIGRIPTHNRNHITSVLITDYLNKRDSAEEAASRVEKKTSHLVALAKMLPNIRHVRLHIDCRHNIKTRRLMSVDLLRVIDGTIQLFPLLKSVHLELHPLVPYCDFKTVEGASEQEIADAITKLILSKGKRVTSSRLGD